MGIDAIKQRDRQNQNQSVRAIFSPAQYLVRVIADTISILGYNLAPIVLTVKACYPQYATHYTCAASFALARAIGRSPGEIAQVLADRIQEQHFSKALPANFSVTAVREGWLNFDLHDRLLVELLSNLHDWSLNRLAMESPKPLESKAVATTSNRYTYVQYAHARCCALLYLAERERIMPDRDNFSWQLLNTDDQFVLCDEAELKVAFTLLAIADEFAYNAGLNDKLPSQIALKLCQKLAADFLLFYDRCRIVSANRDVAIARLGLISSTRKVMTVLVSDYMNLPQEL